MIADFSKIRKGLILSGATALLVPAAFGGLLAGASAIAQNNEPGVLMLQSSAPSSQAADHHEPRTLSSLGRASAVAWISAGHLGR